MEVDENSGEHGEQVQGHGAWGRGMSGVTCMTGFLFSVTLTLTDRLWGMGHGAWGMRRGMGNRNRGTCLRVYVTASSVTEPLFFPDHL
jgi:hypothetical protein